jgi:serine/threonine protein kinase/tetratricopeptide (TPR) repeat protein
MALKCPSCQATNPETSRFCADCGTQIGEHEPNSPEFGILSPDSKTETVQTPIQELSTGSTLAGRYQVIEELGHGGMGRVYKVFDTKIKEKIALKLIKPEIAADRPTIERFSQELKTTRMISHRNVCRMFDLGEDKGSAFITMEYVPGEDLKNLIRMSKRLDAGTAISIARQVCEGLAEAHRLGVVHRDLKPSNIMIDKGGNARIMDFGIARSLSGKAITGAGVMIGTPEYMSPEQVEGKGIDERSDIYSLGVILYEMVTGRRPFEGETALSVAHKQKYEAPVDPKTHNAQIPDDLSRVILRCLEKDKEKRFQNAEELHAELTRIEEELPTTERVVPKRKPTRPQAVAAGAGKAKWPRIALSGGAAVVLGLIVFAGFKLFSNHGEVIDSVAVLPFENVNADPNTDYLCDGITETIIIKLSQLSGFKTVINRASVFTYKGKTADPKKVGLELGVKAVLMTRMSRLGDRLTISPSLVRTKDNSQLWGERYDRKFDDILAIEENIATSIVQALRLKLTTEDQQRINSRPIDNPGAYELYLRANSEIMRFKEGALDRIVQDLQNALDITGPNPLLYTAMSEAYYQYVNIGARQEEFLAKAEDYAKKALALDPGFSGAYSRLGILYYFKDLRESFRHYRTALSLNPNESSALIGLAFNYLDVGKPAAALPLIERLRNEDPLSIFILVTQGLYHWHNGDFDLALDSMRKWYQTDPESPVREFNYAYLLIYNKAFEDAFTIIDKCAAAEPDNVVAKFGLLLKYGLQKDKDRASQLMAPDFESTCRRDMEWSYYIAQAFALMDEKNKALDWLENAVDRGFIDYLLISKKDPFLDNIRGEERFRKLMERVKYEWEHFEE